MILLLSAGALLAAIAGSELVLGETKLQTGLSRVLLAWGSVYVLATCALFFWYELSPWIFTIFWSGAFLSWFGVRSHIESSILLRMAFLLRRNPMRQHDLIAAYLALQGEEARIEELLRGGLAYREDERLTVSSKGRTILGIVARLR